MSKNISIDEVKKLADLSKLSFTKAELLKMTKEIDTILGYVKQLSDVDTTQMTATSQVTGLTNVERPDVEADYHTSRKGLLANAPDSQDGYIKTKRVL